MKSYTDELGIDAKEGKSEAAELIESIGTLLEGRHLLPAMFAMGVVLGHLSMEFDTSIDTVMQAVRDAADIAIKHNGDNDNAPDERVVS